MTTYFFEIYTQKDADGIWGEIEVGHVFAEDRDQAKRKLGIAFGDHEVIDLYEMNLAPLAVAGGRHHVVA